jgi:hypothetical protein
MVYRSPEANSGGNGQSAETAGHQEEAETVCENLAGRWCGIPRSELIVLRKRPPMSVNDGRFRKRCP